MCGFIGFFDQSRRLSSPASLSLVKAMAEAIRHRGPDDHGEWSDPDSGIAFGHRRLSILDLSPEGHQPKSSHCGRYVIIYNGELYNFRDLRKDLEALGHSFRGTSDTEIMLSAFTQWGVFESLKKFNGMFAFALWDKKEKLLHLSRDRVGEKPLYYGWQGKTFFFSSELKAMRVHSDFQGQISEAALDLFIQYNYVPAPHSIYKNIFKLQPGTLLTLPTHSDRQDWTTETYWSLHDTVEAASQNPFSGSDDEAVQALDDLLTDAVKIRMQSDVPLGAFLSGGIDSSTIVALMQKVSTRPVSTFTIGFSEKGFDEAKIAKQVAAHLGTDHTELYLTPQDAMNVIPKLPHLYDEPFSDSSQIPTYLVSQLARQKVTVALSGDAGDELFGGYGRYLRGSQVWNAMTKIPYPIRLGISKTILGVPYQWSDAFFSTLGSITPSKRDLKFKVRRLSDTSHRLAQLLQVKDLSTMHSKIVSNVEIDRVVLNDQNPIANVFSSTRIPNSLTSPMEKMMYLDTLHYLPDDILAKVDRASMGVSLESRIPLLDPRLIQFAWSLPLHFKLREGTGKWLLKQLLYKYVPRQLVERPKMGFSVPIDLWLKGPLRDWAESLLDTKTLQNDGFFSSKNVLQNWDLYLKGKRGRQPLLWSVLMFQSWHQNQVGTGPRSELQG